MGDYIRLRKMLNAPMELPALSAGVVITPLWQAKPMALHTLLRAAYASGGGSVPDFNAWWWPLVEDPEFDPTLVIIASAGTEPVGLIQCWTSSFVKDLVVAPQWRDRGIGAFLLRTAFVEFTRRGAPHIDLKVEASNLAAQRFYRRHGMVEVSG
ncbi:MAG TPA: GNAT family N-acetyltransferase [Devosia sp.]|nr:GNAT family N-acetyltransferase [Devosia sp.]